MGPGRAAGREIASNRLMGVLFPGLLNLFTIC
jgi:hypothetical protein